MDWASATASSVFCQGASGPTIVVAILDAGGTPCALQIRIIGEHGGLCGPSDPGSDVRSPLLSRF
jgi:hypothetical protein